jgi:hypothetical protein
MALLQAHNQRKEKRDKKETVMGNLPVTFSYFFAR